MNANSSFSFTEISKFQKVHLGEPCYFESTDGVKLAYYQVKANHPIASLVFIHGGGAHSGAGYQHLAYELNEKYKVEVYLLDLRGHGRFEGPRGDSRTYVQVWQDIKAFSDWVKNENSAVPLYVGGHSSGGGAVLNYLSWDKNKGRWVPIYIARAWIQIRNGKERYKTSVCQSQNERFCNQLDIRR